ncbi:hypothetical protein [Candidatus Lokiarchaeum ossiferum]|uniref:hypothetical protein n=1 Tax=Candidatus Lokiarchaeum ossiferum TaxID=2951803 RepID=UPI00352BE890
MFFIIFWFIVLLEMIHQNYHIFYIIIWILLLIFLPLFLSFIDNRTIKFKENYNDEYKINVSYDRIFELVNFLDTKGSRRNKKNERNIDLLDKSVTKIEKRNDHDNVVSINILLYVVYSMYIAIYIYNYVESVLNNTTIDTPGFTLILILFVIMFPLIELNDIPRRNISIAKEVFILLSKRILEDLEEDLGKIIEYDYIEHDLIDEIFEVMIKLFYNQLYEKQQLREYLANYHLILFNNEITEKLLYTFEKIHRKIKISEDFHFEDTKMPPEKKKLNIDSKKKIENIISLLKNTKKYHESSFTLKESSIRNKYSIIALILSGISILLNFIFKFVLTD